MRNYNIKFKFECSIEATTKGSHREKKKTARPEKTEKWKGRKKIWNPGCLACEAVTLHMS